MSVFSPLEGKMNSQSSPLFCDMLAGPRSVMNMEETLKRRPFFSSPEELLDEEYYDEQSPEKKRRLSPEQVSIPVTVTHPFCN